MRLLTAVSLVRVQQGEPTKQRRHLRWRRCSYSEGTETAWAFSSVGQSSRLITGRSWVRVPEGPPYRGIAQLVEQRSPKPRVESSNLSAPAKKTAGIARFQPFFPFYVAVHASSKSLDPRAERQILQCVHSVLLFSVRYSIHKATRAREQTKRYTLMIVKLTPFICVSKNYLRRWKQQ